VSISVKIYFDSVKKIDITKRFLCIEIRLERQTGGFFLIGTKIA
jgi:hypothetical protein